ncbi:MAG: diacylglycerol kinase [Myxococcales bacterium]|nr:diacylglycerol kinase [Myxococcales bacterium]
MDIAVLVNLKARRGSERVASACRAALPGARVLSSHTLADAAGFAEELRARPPKLVVSAGGDGTAVALLNALRAPGRSGEHPALGMLALGTGNGWAHATGAPRWRTAVGALGRLANQSALPTRLCELVEICGIHAPFAGTGWDAEIIDDFHGQKEGRGVLPQGSRDGLRGYMHALFTRTIPRHLVSRAGQVEVEVTNIGEEAITVDESGRPVPGPARGELLYRGKVSVCAAGTSPEWGFGFRAFPFAGLVPSRFCLRVYAGDVVHATLRMNKLWRGAHPIAKMHTWMLTRCRAVFSRPVPFQVGGDRLGWRSEVEYGLASEPVQVLDWRALAAA